MLQLLLLRTLFLMVPLVNILTNNQPLLEDTLFCGYTLPVYQRVPNPETKFRYCLLQKL